MARDEDERQRVIREDRMRKGKTASTASAQKEKVDQDPYVPKTWRRKDARPGVESSQAHMDYSSQVLDPIPAHDNGVYVYVFSFGVQFGYVYDGRRKGWFCHRLSNLKEKKN